MEIDRKSPNIVCIMPGNHNSGRRYRPLLYTVDQARTDRNRDRHNRSRAVKKRRLAIAKFLLQSMSLLSAADLDLTLLGCHMLAIKASLYVPRNRRAQEGSSSLELARIKG